jgi:hypothetical protein
MAILLVLDGHAAVSIRKLPARTRAGFFGFHALRQIRIEAGQVVEDSLEAQSAIIFPDDAT